jgi:signal transduction histidine kinase
VQDSGIGLAADSIPYVFHRFWQGQSSDHRGTGGLGLGLALARHIVELHGGSIRAESPGLGKGSTFEIRLPAIVTV